MARASSMSAFTFGGCSPKPRSSLEGMEAGGKRGGGVAAGAGVAGAGFSGAPPGVAGLAGSGSWAAGFFLGAGELGLAGAWWVLDFLALGRGVAEASSSL